MSRSFKQRAVVRVASRIPGLRRIPLFKLLAVAEIALLAKNHVGRLSPDERRRLLELVRKGRGRSAKLAGAEREELAALVARVEPRRFAGLVADKLSPVPLPRRFVEGAPRPAASAPASPQRSLDA